MLIYFAQLRRCILEEKTITLKFSRSVTNKHGETFFSIFFTRRICALASLVQQIFLLVKMYYFTHLLHK
jgi:hypothetical protein